MSNAEKNGAITQSEVATLIAKYENYLKNNEVFGNTNNQKSNHEDYVLNLLNLSENQFRSEMKNGETLKSLLAKENKTNEFNRINSSQFEDTINFAVQSGSITQVEADKILNDYFMRNKLAEVA